MDEPLMDTLKFHEMAMKSLVSFKVVVKINTLDGGFETHAKLVLGFFIPIVSFVYLI